MDNKETYHDRLIKILKFNENEVTRGTEKIAELILDTSRRNRITWLIGNGGSASTVEHFETDLSFLRIDNFIRYPVVFSLTANSSLLTAASNDLAFESVFKALLNRKARPGDLLLAFSASGNSENILNAIEEAKQNEIYTFAILGFDGGHAFAKSDDSLVIKTNFGEYGAVEDIHLSICHAVSSLIRVRLAEEK